MPRKKSPARRARRTATKATRTAIRRQHRTFEMLEQRAMLSADDLLVSSYDGNGVDSVYRFNENSGATAYGSVSSSDAEDGGAKNTGLAVAPDGSFFVSDSSTDEVLHYSNSGTFLGVLDTEDAGGDYAPLVEPGTLAFGPDGNLYVGDLGSGNIFQFNVNVARPWQSSGTININVDPSSDGSVGGFTFALNGDVLPAPGRWLGGRIPERQLFELSDRALRLRGGLWRRWRSAS